jgi:hypothetical protein
MNANQIKVNMQLLVTGNEYGHEFPIGSLVKVVKVKRVKKVGSINSDVLYLTCESVTLSSKVQWTMGESELDLPAPYQAPQKGTSLDALTKALEIASNTPKSDWDEDHELLVEYLHKVLMAWATNNKKSN